MTDRDTSIYSPNYYESDPGKMGYGLGDIKLVAVLALLTGMAVGGALVYVLAVMG